MSTDAALVSLSQAHKALSACRTAMDAKHVADMADVAKVYLQRTRAGVEAVNQATEIRILAERQMGAFLATTEKAKGARGNPGGQGAKIVQCPKGTTQTLASIGITKKQSARAQRLAAIPDAEFAAALEKAKTSAGRLTIKAVSQYAVTRKRAKEESPTGIVGCIDELPRDTFGCIYVDPPWRYANQGTRGATNNHYSTMTVDEICALPVGELALPKSHLHLWTTNGFIEQAFGVFRAWGFEFKSTFVWVKPQMGMGNYWRNSHEIMLTGTRGGLTAASRAEMSWVECSRGAHSAKPDQVRARIERLSPGPYLELFGRRRVVGWTVFGNEVVSELI